MSSEGATIPSQAVPFEASSSPSPASPPSSLTWLGLVVGAASLVCSVMLWQKVTGMQEQLAKQAAEATQQAVQAHTMAREAQDLVRDAAAKLAVMEARVNEVSLQRGQLDALVHNLTRSRDETLLIDIESALRMAQQQVLLTGNTEALVATLQSAYKRLERAAQPRLFPLQQAIQRDLDRLAQSTVTDTSSLLARLDDLARHIDALPVLSDAPVPRELRQPMRYTGAELPAAEVAATPGQWQWWTQWSHRIWQAVRTEARELLRVSRIDQPDAALMAPEQAFFLRENLKLKLLNARLGVLSRQYDAARMDIQAAQQSLSKYFDPASRRVHQTQSVLSQLHTHMQATAQPSLDDTLSALSSAAASF